MKIRKDSAATYFVGLDGLRGIAVLAVILTHFGMPGVKGGYLGVDIFFVLSGFVVSTSLLRSVGKHGWVRRFYFRRFSRLAPVLLVFLGFVTTILVFDGVTTGYETKMLFSVAGQYYNFTLLDVPPDTSKYVLHLWSLSVEFHFYLFAPLLLAASRFVPTKAVIAMLTALVSCIVMTRAAFLYNQTYDSSIIYLHTYFRIDGMLLGVILALLPRHRYRQWFLKLGGPSLAGIVLLLAFASRAGDATTHAYSWAFIAIAVLAAVCVGAVSVRVVDSPTWWSVLLESKLFIYLGQRSYSLYIWHYALGVGWLTAGDQDFQGVPFFMLQLVVALLAAEASYSWIEKPLRNLLNRRL